MALKHSAVTKAVDRYAELANQKSAIETEMSELRSVIIDYLKTANVDPGEFFYLPDGRRIKYSEASTGRLSSEKIMQALNLSSESELDAYKNFSTTTRFYVR